jgi:hypothetical protein
MSVGVIDAGHDAFLEFVLGSDPDVAQDRTGELGEEALDEVEPGTVLWCEGELKAAVRLGGEPSFGFPGDVGGMIVEDQLDRGAGRIGGIEKLEKLDELPAPVAVSDQGMDLPVSRSIPASRLSVPCRLYS